MAYRADVLATQPRLHDFSDILDGYLLQGSQPNPRSPTEQPAADKLAGAEAIDHFAPPDADTLWLDDPYTPVQQMLPRADGKQAQLQAQSFVDVLSHVASDWWTHPLPALQSQPQAQPAGLGVEDAGSAHGGRMFLQTVQDAQNDSLSNPATILSVPADHGQLHQSHSYENGTPLMPHIHDPRLHRSSPDAGTSSMAYEEADSDREDNRFSRHPSGGSNSRGNREAPMQQKRTRKREKDHIEELQASVARVCTEFAEMKEQQAELTHRLQAKEEELRRVRMADEASALQPIDEEELAGSFEGNVVLTVDEDAPVTLTPSQIKAMSETDLAAWWAKYIKQLAVLLATADGNAELAPDVTARIQTLQREALFLHVRVSVTNMRAVKKFMAHGRVEHSRVAFRQEGAAMWQEAAEALALTDKQKQAVSALWRTLEAKLGALLSGRRTLHARLRATMPNGVLGRDFAVNFLKAHELMRALQANMRQEHVLACDFASAFYQILDMVQNARCMVHCWPWFPDVISVAVWIAALHNDSMALPKLQLHGLHVSPRNGEHP